MVKEPEWETKGTPGAGNNPGVHVYLNSETIGDAIAKARNGKGLNFPGSLRDYNVMVRQYACKSRGHYLSINLNIVLKEKPEGEKDG